MSTIEASTGSLTKSILYNVYIYIDIETENKGQRFNTDKLFEFRIENRFRAYYLRVGYAHRLERQSPDHAPPWAAPKLTFREYLPVKRATGYENITELLEKVDDIVRRKGEL